MSPTLFLNVLTMQARKSMSYRADFWIGSTLGFVVTLGVLVFLWKAMFHEAGTEVIGGYTLAEMVTYYILVILLGKIIRGTEFGAGTMAEEIYDGSLTRYLIYPVRYFPFKFAQNTGELTTSFMQLLLFGTACVFLFPMPETMQVTPASLAMCVVSVVLANLLHFALYCPIELVAFWQDQVWSLRVMARFGVQFLGGAMIPLSLFPDWTAGWLRFLPFQYIYYLPVNTLIGKATTAEWALGLAVTAAWIGIFALATRLVWKRGIAQYTGVGI